MRLIAAYSFISNFSLNINKKRFSNLLYPEHYSGWILPTLSNSVLESLGKAGTPIVHWGRFQSYFSKNRWKTCDNESHEKETKHAHTSPPADLLHIRIGNLDWWEWGHCKNETREIYCLCFREVDAILAMLKSRSAREASRRPAFMGIRPTISHTC